MRPEHETAHSQYFLILTAAAGTSAATFLTFFGTTSNRESVILAFSPFWSPLQKGEKARMTLSVKIEIDLREIGIGTNQEGRICNFREQKPFIVRL